MAGPIESRLVGSQRDVESLRCVCVREIQEMVEDERRSLVDGKLSEAAVELVPDRHGGLTVRGRRAVDRQEGHLDRPTTAIVFREAVAASDQQPVDPGLESLRVAESAELEQVIDEP